MNCDKELDCLETAQELLVTWNIQPWKEFKNLSPNRALQSPGFRVKNQEWYLTIYPNGYAKANYGYVSVFLHLKHAKEVLTPITLIIKIYVQVALKRSNNEVLSLQFDSTHNNWGYFDFISRQLLEDDFVNDDTFTVKLVVEDKKLYCDDLVLPLCKSLYDNSFKGDILINCSDGKSIRADIFILKNTPYFKAVILGQTSHESLEEEVNGVATIAQKVIKNTGTIASINSQASCTLDRSQSSFRSCRSNDSVSTAHDEHQVIESAADRNILLEIDLTAFNNTVVNHLLEFLYTGITRIPTTIELRCELFTLSELFGVSRLGSLLEEQIVELDFKPEKIMCVLGCFVHRSSSLRDLAVEFFVGNREDLKASTGYEERLKSIFNRDNPDLNLLLQLI